MEMEAFRSYIPGASLFVSVALLIVGQMSVILAFLKGLAFIDPLVLTDTSIIAVCCFLISCVFLAPDLQPFKNCLMSLWFLLILTLVQLYIHVDIDRLQEVLKDKLFQGFTMLKQKTLVWSAIAFEFALVVVLCCWWELRNLYNEANKSGNKADRLTETCNAASMKSKQKEQEL